MREQQWGVWRAVGLLAWSGCVGYPGPPPIAEAESTGGSMGTTTGVGMEADATTGTGTTTTHLGTTTEVAETSTTGPIAECGNGDVEAGEECDGTDWNGATCESLGHDPGALACTEACAFDVVGCVPPGMVLVPGGVFEMGSNISADEMPIRQVQVDRFWIDETEVKVEAYSACVDGGSCNEPGIGGSCNWMVAGRGDHPVNCVTWQEAADYCAWAGGGTKRLPTEAEWEKAARGTDAREYAWGDSPAPSCSHVVMDYGGDGCDNYSTLQVGSKPMGDSLYGAHDMAGNVWEWVADWYADPYSAAETNNPIGPVTGSVRVVRGGSWVDSLTNEFRAADRNEHNPINAVSVVGVRCARTPPAPL